MKLRVAALLTSHNRRDKTIACLRALREQDVDGVVVNSFVVDAASSDGTPEAIALQFPDVTILRGGADMYWNQGMHAAFTHTVELGFDYYLWLNDDTFLDRGALRVMLDAAVDIGEPAIVVGSTRDAASGALTYGGVVRPLPRWRPMRFELREPTDSPRKCEAMNGNCVLVPHAVVERIGMLDPVFTHGMGDFDYGLRANAAGIGVWIAAGTVGTCSRNSSWSSQGLRRDLRYLRGPKGLPWQEWRTMTRRWAGPAWPIFAVSPYVRWLFRRVVLRES